MSVSSFEFSNSRTVGATLLLIGCEELVFVRHLVTSSDFLLRRETSRAVKMQGFSDRHKLPREGFPL